MYRSNTIRLQDDPETMGRGIDGWIKAIDADEKFVRLTKENRDYLINLLKDVKTADSYLASPTYMTFTGRYGLWVFEEDGAYVPLCLHPNVDGQVLIFPVIGISTKKTLPALLERLPEPPMGYRLVRLDASDVGHLTSCGADYAAAGVSCFPASEHILDWAYPVRILSTKRVSALEGHEFKRIRNRIRHAAELMPTKEPLSEKNFDAVKQFVREWAIAKSNTPEQLENFQSPYMSILDNFGDARLRLEGLVFFVSGKVQAFTVWDTPPNGEPVANRFANLCCESRVGLSDYVMQTVAGHLADKGVNFLNLGGSESKGLDDYKNKFSPVISLGLASADVFIDPTFYPQTNAVPKAAVVAKLKARSAGLMGNNR